MFTYLKNLTTDAALTTIGGTEVIPLFWFWERIGQTNGPYVYISVSLLCTFLLYGGISLVEVIAFALIGSGEVEFAAFYFSTVGYWGSIIGYAFPWIFALL